MTTEQPPEPYTAAETAKLLRCSVKHVYDLVKRRKLKALPFRPVRIPRDHVHKLLAG